MISASIQILRRSRHHGVGWHSIAASQPQFRNRAEEDTNTKAYSNTKRRNLPTYKNTDNAANNRFPFQARFSFSTSATARDQQLKGTRDDGESHDRSVGEDSSTRKTYGKYHARPWEEYYRALVEFHKQHGHSNVPHGARMDPSLAYFVKKQRNNRDSLTKEQIEKLDALDFNWETGAEKQERKWNERYNELVEFKNQNGHCDCPTSYPPNPSLGRWVHRQRRLHKIGHLPSNRVELLDKIGFSWAIEDVPERDTTSHDKKWRRQFLKLVDHVKKHGNCVIRSVDDEDPSLGNWVRFQRVQERKGLLRPDRKKLLEEIGFVFDIDITNPSKSILQQQWDEMFDYLLQYKEEEGHLNVPHTYKGNEGLGGWVAQQRRREKEGKLEDIRRQRLLAIGFDLGESREEMWQRKFQEWRSFHEKRGRDPARRDDPSLASWVFFQRSLYWQGKLSEERQEKLESSGFNWRARSSREHFQ